ncbi:hypothetical protein J3B01_004583 [Coemansia erecta]|nr:hypothetical protein J3B01_004583 [Coemansia erecta]
MSAIVNRQAVQEAEDDVLRHSGLLDSRPRDGHKALLRSKRWRRSGAIAVCRAVAWMIRYPLHTATMCEQFGAHNPLLVGDVMMSARRLWHGLPVGAVYERTSNWHLHVAGLATGLVAPKATTLVRTACGVVVHYVSYATMYGLMRQSVAARLLSTRNVQLHSLVWPSVLWVRDLWLLRSPRGSVLSLYVRDILSSIVQGALCVLFTRVLTSQSAIHVYRRVERVDRMWQRWGLARTEHETRAHAVEASADASSMFRRAEDQLVQMHDSGDELTTDQCVVDRQAMRSVEFLVYTQSVASMVASVVARAILYPIDSVFVRLLADEAGLTSYAYSGFVNCLLRVYSADGVRMLYAGFPFAVASDLALSWLTAEAMHFLCKSAWIVF